MDLLYEIEVAMAPICGEIRFLEVLSHWNFITQMMFLF